MDRLTGAASPWKLMIDGIEYGVTKLAGKEVRLESVDGKTTKYRAVSTIEKLLLEQAIVMPTKPRSRKPARAR